MSADIENQLSDIQQLAQQNPNIDATTLMISALEQEHADQTEAKRRRWIYLAAIGLPPFGYLIAIYYRFFSSKKDAVQIAWWCIGLTTFSLVLTIISLKIILTAATQTTGQQFNAQQFEQTPAELQSVIQQ